MKMNICNISSFQRVVNFTKNNGKVSKVDEPGAIIPGVTMICDLPLLFMNGFPTCLENLTVDQLDTFVPYMIQCSGKSVTKPKWWPDDVEFSIKPKRPRSMSKEEWMSRLKRIVLCCYSYHGCEYALKLCQNKTHECQSSEWTYIDGLDGTMLLFNKLTRQRSPFFRTASLLVDKRKFFSTTVSDKCLMDFQQKHSTKPFVEARICNSCDSEFISIKEMRMHKRVCLKKYPPMSHIQKLGTSGNSILSDLRQKYAPKMHINSGNDHTPSVNQCVEKQTARQALRSSNLRIFPSNTLPEFFHGKRIGRVSLTETSECETLSSRDRTRYSSTPFLSNVGYCSAENSSQDISPKAHNTYRNNRASVRRKKMSLAPSKSSQDGNLVHISYDDKFLSGKCNHELTSYRALQHNDTISCSTTHHNAPPIISEEEKITQDNFLNYFGLSKKCHSRLNSSDNLSNKAQLGNTLKYTSIPVSSLLGKRIHGRSQMPQGAISNKIEKIERYCSAKPIDSFVPEREKNNIIDWRVSWSSRKAVPESQAHSYLYPMQQWWKMPLLRQRQIKMERTAMFLNRSKELRVKLRKLTDAEIKCYLLCKPVSVRLRRMTPEEIASYTNPFNVTPKLKRLSSQEIEAYTTPHNIAPKIKRLNLKEIMKYSPNTLSDVTHRVANDLNGQPLITSQNKPSRKQTRKQPVNKKVLHGCFLKKNSKEHKHNLDQFKSFHFLGSHM